MAVARWLDSVVGELLDSADLQNAAESEFQIAGEAVSAIANLSSMASRAWPLVPTFNGTMTVALGGTNQRVFIQNRLANEIPAQNLTFGSNATGLVRMDLVVGQYSQIDGNPFARAVRQTDGSILVTTCYQWFRGASFSVVAGTAGSGIPATPGGFVAIAVVTVASGATQIQANNWTFVLPDFLGGVGLPFGVLEGLDSTGATDASASANAQIAQFLSEGITQIMWPSGTFLCTNAVGPPTGVGNFTLEGCGPGTILVQQGNAHILSVSNANGWVARGFTLHGNASASAGSVLFASNCTDVTVENCNAVNGFNGYTFTTTCSDVKLKFVRASAMQNYGCNFNNFSAEAKIVGCDFHDNGVHGISITGTAGGVSVMISNSRCGNNNTSGTTGSGLHIGANITSVVMVGGRLGSLAPSTGSQLYGIDLAAGCDSILLIGVGLYSNTGGPVNIAGTIGADVRFQDCPGYSVGVQNVSTPATNVAVINPFGKDVVAMVDPNGATVTQVKIAGIHILGNLTAPGPIPWPAGKTLTLSYSGGTPVIQAVGD